MYKFIFNRVKKIIPKISETEIIALKSGGTSIDRELFKGHISYSKLFAPISKCNNSKCSISRNMDKKTDELLRKVGSSSIYPGGEIKDIMTYLGKHGFLSMIIDKEYGGCLTVK